MQRKSDFAPGEYYHLYSRGNGKRKIFLSDQDRLRFQVLLYIANNVEAVHLSNHQGRSLMEMFNLERPATLVNIGAYCLMPNHFHLLVREKNDHGISSFMKKLLTAYSMYFNTRYEHTGGLFEGRFRSEHLDDDRYLNYIYAYIHLNPVKIKDPKNWERKIIPRPAQALQFLKQYRYSSFSDYLGQSRTEGTILERKTFPAYFAKTADFSEFIKDWMEYEETETIKD